MAYTPEEKKVIIEALSRHVEHSNSQEGGNLGVVDLVMLSPSEKEELLREWLPRLKEAKLSALEELERKKNLIAESLNMINNKVTLMKESIAATDSLASKLS